jgi:hypothetical protein
MHVTKETSPGAKYTSSTYLVLLGFSFAFLLGSAVPLGRAHVANQMAQIIPALRKFAGEISYLVKP